MGRDQAWLQELCRRRSAGEPWQRELAAFLTEERERALREIAAQQRDIGARGARAADAEDILQQASASFATRGLDLYRGDAAPSTYFTTFLRNATIAFYRPKRRRNEITEAERAPEDPNAPVRPTGTTGPEVDTWSLRRDLYAALTKAYTINADLAEAVDLYKFQNRGTAAECAAIVGIAEDNFSQRVSRGMLLLREILALGGYER